jgi:hypothetical protein
MTRAFLSLFISLLLFLISHLFSYLFASLPNLCLLLFIPAPPGSPSPLPARTAPGGSLSKQAGTL